MSPAPPDSGASRLAPLFVILAASLWGLDGIVLRPALYTLPVALVVCIESGVIALLLTVALARRLPELRALDRRDWLSFLAVALFGGVIGTMSITKALFYVDFVNLSIVVLIQKLQPVFAIALAALILKETPGRRFYGWAVLAVAGAYLMTFGMHLPVMGDGDKTVVAALFALMAAAGFGSSTVFGKRALRNISFALGTYVRFLLTALLMLAVALGTGDIAAVDQVSDAQVIILVLIVFTTGTPGIFLYYYGLKRITASVATICELAFPLTAVLLEYLVRGNTLGPLQWMGVGILFVSIVQVSKMRPQSV